MIDTGVAAQTRTITVTLEKVMGSGGGGTYSLRLLDGSAGRSDVTRPISGTLGFSVGLTTLSVTLGATQGSRTTFDVTVTVDGRPAPIRLARAGIDATGREATEFLWWVAARSGTGPTVRMPFFYRAAEWNSAIHAQSLTVGYAVVYHDHLDASLAMTRSAFGALEKAGGNRCPSSPPPMTGPGSRKGTRSGPVIFLRFPSSCSLSTCDSRPSPRRTPAHPDEWAH